MPKRFPGLTLEEHQEIGAKLRSIRSYLEDLTKQTDIAYGVTSKASKKTHAVRNALQGLRCEMDDVLFKQHRDRKDVDLPAIYYG